MTTAKRVAIAATALAALIGILKRREIAAQVTKAISSLPGFFDAMKDAPQNARFRTLETADPKEAEESFLWLKDPHKGSERFPINPNMVEFMASSGRVVLEAEAARSKIPGAHVVKFQEEPPLTYIVAVTSRNLSIVFRRE